MYFRDIESKPGYKAAHDKLHKELSAERLKKVVAKKRAKKAG